MKQRILILLILIIPSGLFAQTDTINIVLFGHYERLHVEVYYSDSLLKKIDYRKNIVRPGILLRHSIAKHSKAVHISLPIDKEKIVNDSITLVINYKKPFHKSFKKKEITTVIDYTKNYLIIFRSSKCKKFCFVPDWSDEIPGWQ